MNDLEAQNNSLKICSTQNIQIAVKHLNLCFLTTYVQNRYLEVLFGKSGENKFKYTLKHLLS